MALGDNCRSGCLSKDHTSWGDCARDAGLRVGWLETMVGYDMRKERSVQSELSEYKSLRDQGIQPAGTTRYALDAAKSMSDRIGKAYNAEKMPPVNMLTKQTVKAASEAGIL